MKEWYKKLSYADRFGNWLVGLKSSKKRFLREHFQKLRIVPEYKETFDLFLRLMGRGYKAGMPSGLNTPWMSSRGTADKEIQGSLPKLINKSRELERDDPIGSGLINSFVSNVVGSGMTPQANTKDDKKDDKIEAVWNDLKDSISRVENVDHDEHQRMLMRSVFRDGSVFAHPTKTSAQETVYIESIEKDRVTSPLTVAGRSRLENGNFLIDGVEKTPEGIPVAYLILKPGKQGSSLDDYDRFPAEMINHLKRPGIRAGQTHGVPLLHAVLQPLRDLDLLLLAGMKRTQVASMLTTFITSEFDIDDLIGETVEKGDSTRDLKNPMQPGMMVKLLPGEQVSHLVPNFPTPEFVPFIIMLARQIGTAVGVSWTIVLKDFSKSNYSSARTDLLEARQTYKLYQKFFVKYLNWEWIQILTDAKLRGDNRLRGISYADLKKVEWVPPGWNWVDPLKEAQANALERKTGTKTLREIAAEKGKYWKDEINQNLIEEKYEIDKRVSMGLPPKDPEDEARWMDYLMTPQPDPVEEERTDALLE